MCGAHATCDMAGACACEKGFKGDGQTCDDIDECSEGMDDCAATATCANTEGGFTCACPDGTVGDPNKGCEPRFTQVAAGAYHTCAVRADGSLYCFGNGGSGKLGNGLSEHQPAPVKAGAAANWKHVVAGSSHTCGIKDTGTLWCWGAGSFGQLGLGYPDTQVLPQTIRLDRFWTSVGTGDTHTCAVENDGSLSCWGRNNLGQLATGSANPQELLPVKVSVVAGQSETDWKEVFVGRDTTCATKQDGKLYCWGRNSDSQVAKSGGGTVAIPWLVETSVGAADSDWKEAAIGFTACGLKTTGKLFCWGRGLEGQLGVGTLVSSAVPAEVPPPAGATWQMVRAGLWHMCALDSTGALWCWGRNQSAQVQDGAEGHITKPIQVGSDTDWVDLSGGVSHMCGLKKDGRLFCWGSRVFGEIGDGTMSLPLTPKPIGKDTWSRISAYGEVGCAISTAGQLACWGNNENGQLGTGDTASRNGPAPASGMDMVSRVGVGRQHACAVTKAGEMRCTGKNANGQLGSGNNTPQSTFLPILSSGKAWANLLWKEVSAGEEHNCAVATEGSLWCWGLNSNGQLGQATNPAIGTLVQVLPATPKDWKVVAAGQLHTCATRADTSLWCWGRNTEGQLGNNMPLDGKIPPVNLGTGWSDAVAAGFNHTCAVKLDGTLWCWGKNATSQIGDGTTADHPTPFQVGMDTDWVTVTAGSGSTCATKNNDTVYCWGSNGFGQLGSGDFATKKIPTLLAGKAAWAVPALGFSHAAGLQKDGTLWGWGSGELGQNGTGDGWPVMPVLVGAVN